MGRLVGITNITVGRPVGRIVEIITLLLMEEGEFMQGLLSWPFPSLMGLV